MLANLGAVIKGQVAGAQPPSVPPQERGEGFAEHRFAWRNPDSAETSVPPR